MVKSKPSMTAASKSPESAALRAVEEEIARLKEETDSVIENAKAGIWDLYSELLEEDDRRRLRALLDDYEPSVTESYVAELVYGGDAGLNGIYYEEAMDPLNIALGWSDVDAFYVRWSGLRRLTEERKRLLAGQLVMRLG